MDVAAHTIFAALAGSHAHGTAREGSDIDVRGVCVAPMAVRVSLSQRFEQFEGLLDGALRDRVVPALRTHPSAARALGTKAECTVFDIAKFLSLCMAANPNALEILFADDADVLIETPAWATVRAARGIFLTRRVGETYSGYALAQLKRIRTHRSWLMNPPRAKPSRSDFGLPDAPTLSHKDRARVDQAVADRIRGYGLEDLELPRYLRVALTERLTLLETDLLAVAPADAHDAKRDAAMHALSLPPDAIAALGAERRYRAAMSHWESFESWKRERNPARAELEARFGYDTKHAMHLIRLMRMGIEILREGALRVRRPDAAELAAIRDGGMTYDALVAEAERLHATMHDAAAVSPLPASVDVGAVDSLLLALVT
jgi:predicted nucleotidyltransferase